MPEVGAEGIPFSSHHGGALFERKPAPGATPPPNLAAIAMNPAPPGDVGCHRWPPPGR
jgi:hypothetical protein